MLMPETKKAKSTPPDLVGAAFNADLIVPAELIWAHTKTDPDTLPQELLNAYRDSALENAERYTGLLFRGQKVITQDVSDGRDPMRGKRWRKTYKVRLTHPTADGIIYLYGTNKHFPDVRTLSAIPGATVIDVPYDHFAIDMSPCCGEHGGSNPANTGMRIMYRAGYACERDIPACVRIGALKYIAWLVTNPGDGAQQQTGYADTNPQTSGNNASWRSGAIEEWRLCVQDTA